MLRSQIESIQFSSLWFYGCLLGSIHTNVPYIAHCFPHSFLFLFVTPIQFLLVVKYWHFNGVFFPCLFFFFWHNDYLLHMVSIVTQRSFVKLGWSFLQFYGSFCWNFESVFSWINALKRSVSFVVFCFQHQRSDYFNLEFDHMQSLL